jgi:hypothetical protein
MWMMVVCPPELPMPSKINVAASSARVSATAPVVRSEATNNHVVKMPHAHRYRPSAAFTSSGAILARSNWMRTKNEIQNAP